MGGTTAGTIHSTIGIDHIIGDGAGVRIGDGIRIGDGTSRSIGDIRIHTIHTTHIVRHITIIRLIIHHIMVA